MLYIRLRRGAARKYFTLVFNAPPGSNSPFLQAGISVSHVVLLSERAPAKPRCPLFGAIGQPEKAGHIYIQINKYDNCVTQLKWKRSEYS
jgi:hypothetical protein